MDFVEQALKIKSCVQNAIIVSGSWPVIIRDSGGLLWLVMIRFSGSWPVEVRVLAGDMHVRNVAQIL